MKLRCERDLLVEALATAGRAAGSGTGGPQALSGVHLRLQSSTLTLTSTDRDLSIQVQVEVAGVEDGTALLPSRLTADIVRSLEPGAVTLTCEEDQASISAGRSHFSVFSYPPEEFPHLSPPEGAGVVLAAGELNEAMRQVVRAASTDENRFNLTGVLLSAEGEGLRMVATDGFRLALRDLVGTAVLSEGQQVIVPARALSELQRLLSTGSSLAGPPVRPAPDSGRGEAGAEIGPPGAGRQVTVRVGELDATFEVGSVLLSTRLLKINFPNYRQLMLPSYPNRLVVGKDPLLDAVRRVKLLVRDALAPVRMALGPDGIQLTASTEEIGQASEDVDAKYEGTEMCIAFNPTFLMAGVEAVTGDEVLIEIFDASRAAMMRGSESDPYRY
ncbi:MAG: DNA polymerase III subunit beta, partial [Acidimicrobiales bacterium]